jgi:tetratricopeptide (TPR) repeat protein
MSKRQDARISHSALTDHRILANPDETVPVQVPGATVNDLPGLLLLDAHQDQQPLPLLTRLAIYGEMMNLNPDFRPAYLELLDKAAISDPGDPLVLAALGRRAFLQMSAQSVGYLSRAVEKGAPGPQTYIDLSKALNRAGRSTDATGALERGASQFPYVKNIRKFLILSYIQSKQYAKAEPEMERYVADFPEDDLMRNLLEQVRSSAPEQ